jgi:hypothetical protein
VVDGFVCWTKRLTDLEADGTTNIPPDQLEDTHKIRAVTEYVMPGVTRVTLTNQAFIASVM